MEDIDRWVNKVYAAEGDRAELERLYDEWAEDYERHKWASGNPGIAIAVGKIGRHLRDFDARILDAGCGTGNVGLVLHQIGYRNLEALDPSNGMLEAARGKGIYQALHPLFLDQDIDLPANSYDLVVASGVFTEGHAPPTALDGLLKLTMPGGIIVFSLSETAASELGFAERIANLIDCEAWQLIERTQAYRSFPFSDAEAHVLIRIYVMQKSEANDS